ncbi:MAG: calcium/sodium antiporter [Bacteroidia bacterium]
MLEAVAFLILGVVVLLGGGELLVREAIKVALRARISILVVASTIVAFATSAPELVVSIYAAFFGTPDISVGNVVGSNISNIGLILGATAIIRPVILRKTTLTFDWPIMIISALMLIIFSWNFSLGFIEGSIFIICLIFYSSYLIINSRKSGVDQSNPAKEIEEEEKKAKKHRPVIVHIVLLLVAILALYLGSRWFVWGATELAVYFGVSERIVALTIVSIGTSLPEMMTSIIAVVKRNADIAVGSLVGSNIFNIFSILGITALLKPIQISEVFLQLDYFWMIGLSLLLFPLMHKHDKITRGGGFMLLGFYLLYLVYIL